MYEELLYSKKKKKVSITILRKKFSGNGEETHTKLITASMTVLDLGDKMPVVLCASILTSNGALSREAWHPCGAADSKYSTCLSDLVRRASDEGNSCGGRQSGSWTTHLGSRYQDNLNTEPSSPYVRRNLSVPCTDIQNIETGGQDETCRSR